MLLPFLKRERRRPSLVRDGRRIETIKLLGDRILVRPIVQAATQGGVLLPDIAQSKPQQGEVLAIGPGVRNKRGALVRPDLTIGDHIVFAEHAGQEIARDGERFLILREADVFGVLETRAAARRAA